MGHLSIGGTTFRITYTHSGFLVVRFKELPFTWEQDYDCNQKSLKKSNIFHFGYIIFRPLAQKWGCLVRGYGLGKIVVWIEITLWRLKDRGCNNNYLVKFRERLLSCLKKKLTLAGTSCVIVQCFVDPSTHSNLPPYWLWVSITSPESLLCSCTRVITRMAARGLWHLNIYRVRAFAETTLLEILYIIEVPDKTQTEDVHKENKWV